MSEPIGIPDIAAFLDVLVDLQCEAGDMTLGRTVEMLDALDGVAARLKAVTGAVKTQQLLLTKEPVVHAGTVYASKPTGKWRPDKPKIRRQVIGKATHTKDGEPITDPEVVAGNVYDLMAALYVSPSTEPKSGGIELLGVKKKELMHWQHTGHEVVTKPLGEVGDDE